MSAQNWISVLQKMPENDSPVLVYTPKNQHQTIWIDCWQMQQEDPLGFSSVAIEVGYGWDGFEFEEVTHWKPLPDAPKGGCTYPQCECEEPGQQIGCVVAEGEGNE